MSSGRDSSICQTLTGGNELFDEGRTQDIGALRNDLARRMREHPPECWSNGFIIALIGLYTAHQTNCLLVGVAERIIPGLRIVR